MEEGRIWPVEELNKDSFWSRGGDRANAYSSGRREREHEREREEGKEGEEEVILIYVSNEVDAIVSSVILKHLRRLRSMTVCRTIEQRDAFPAQLAEEIRNYSMTHTFRSRHMSQHTQLSIRAVFLLGFGGSSYTPLQFYEKVEMAVGRRVPLIAVLDRDKPPKRRVFIGGEYPKWHLLTDNSIQFGGGITEFHRTLMDLQAELQYEAVTDPDMQCLPECWTGPPLSFLVTQALDFDPSDRSRRAEGYMHNFLHWLSAVGVCYCLANNSVHDRQHATLLNALQQKLVHVPRSKDSPSDPYAMRVVRRQDSRLPFFPEHWSFRRILRWSPYLCPRTALYGRSGGAQAVEDRLEELRYKCRVSPDEFSERISNLSRPRVGEILRNVCRRTGVPPMRDAMILKLDHTKDLPADMTSSHFGSLLMALTAEEMPNGIDGDDFGKAYFITVALTEFLGRTSDQLSLPAFCCEQLQCLCERTERQNKDLIRQAANAEYSSMCSSVLVVAYLFDLEDHLSHGSLLRVIAYILAIKFQKLRNQVRPPCVLLGALRRSDKVPLLLGWVPHVAEETSPWDRRTPLLSTLANISRTQAVPVQSIDGTYPGLVQLRPASSAPREHLRHAAEAVVEAFRRRTFHRMGGRRKGGRGDSMRVDSGVDSESNTNPDGTTQPGFKGVTGAKGGGGREEHSYNSTKYTTPSSSNRSSRYTGISSTSNNINTGAGTALRTNRVGSNTMSQRSSSTCSSSSICENEPKETDTPYENSSSSTISRSGNLSCNSNQSINVSVESTYSKMAPDDEPY